jgi:hypothetical protein
MEDVLGATLVFVAAIALAVAIHTAFDRRTPTRLAGIDG